MLLPLLRSYCTILLKLLYFKIKNVFSIFCFFNVLCEKYYKPVRVLYYIADCVGWTPRLNLLDLGMHSQLGTHSYVGDLLYFPHIICSQHVGGCSITVVIQFYLNHHLGHSFMVSRRLPQH